MMARWPERRRKDFETLAYAEMKARTKRDTFLATVAAATAEAKSAAESYLAEALKAKR